MSKPYFLPSNLAAIRGLFNIYLTFIRKVLNRYAFHAIAFSYNYPRGYTIALYACFSNSTIEYCGEKARKRGFIFCHNETVLILRNESPAEHRSGDLLGP